MLICYNWDLGKKMLFHHNKDLENKMLFHQNQELMIKQSMWLRVGNGDCFQFE
jgi:hypothetical protein